MNWNNYSPYFTEAEFDCKHTGKNKMRPEFMDRLLQIRKTFNKPMVITSGYRHETHPIEAAKPFSGEHSYGVACDIAIHGLDAMDLMVVAYGHGIRRIGVSQKGGSRFLHLGAGDNELGFPSSMWSY